MSLPQLQESRVRSGGAPPVVPPILPLPSPPHSAASARTGTPTSSPPPPPPAPSPSPFSSASTHGTAQGAGGSGDSPGSTSEARQLVDGETGDTGASAMEVTNDGLQKLCSMLTESLTLQNKQLDAAEGAASSVLRTYVEAKEQVSAGRGVVHRAAACVCVDVPRVRVTSHGDCAMLCCRAAASVFAERSAAPGYGDAPRRQAGVLVALPLLLPPSLASVSAGVEVGTGLTNVTGVVCATAVGGAEGAMPGASDCGSTCGLGSSGPCRQRL